MSKKKKKKMNTEKAFAIFCVGIMVISLVAGLIVYLV